MILYHTYENSIILSDIDYSRCKTYHAVPKGTPVMKQNKEELILPPLYIEKNGKKLTLYGKSEKKIKFPMWVYKFGYSTIQWSFSYIADYRAKECTVISIEFDTLSQCVFDTKEECIQYLHQYVPIPIISRTDFYDIAIIAEI
jgi:hypothetical protein